MRRSFWIVTLVVVLGAFAGWQQLSSWSTTQPSTDAIGQTKTAESEAQSRGASSGRSGRQGRGGGGRDVVPVLLATAKQKAVPIQIRAVGNVEPFATVAVRSQVTGVLQKAHFKEGQTIKRGDLLFTIDPRPFEAALKQAEAALARDTAQVQNWREQARRYAELLKKQYVSQEQYDQIRANADAAEAVVQADLAAVENARVQLSYCYIYAPIEGQAGVMLVHEGNLVRVNDATPLVVINQVMPIYVTFGVPEQHLIDIKRHMAVGKLQALARFEADEGRAEEGLLVFVDNAVDRTTGTIKLKAEFKNTEKRLWPGQFINISLILKTQPNAVVIPSEAVQVGQDGQHVFVAKADGTVEVRPVILSMTTEGEAVVAQGLSAGERVVREGQFLLGPGSRIEVKNEGGSAHQDGGNNVRAKGERRTKGKTS
jgi:membrane fusion protein, multidrug efflux system